MFYPSKKVDTTQCAANRTLSHVGRLYVMLSRGRISAIAAEQSLADFLLTQKLTVDSSTWAGLCHACQTLPRAAAPFLDQLELVEMRLTDLVSQVGGIKGCEHPHAGPQFAGRDVFYEAGIR